MEGGGRKHLPPRVSSRAKSPGLIGLTHAHSTFVYKLNINNHKTVSNEKDMNNLFN